MINLLKLPNRVTRWRGTLADFETEKVPNYGIYLIVYSQNVLYVGKSIDISARIYQHIICPNQLFGKWLALIGRHEEENIQIDILYPSPEIDFDVWANTYERKIIKKFQPSFNTEGLY